MVTGAGHIIGLHIGRRRLYSWVGLSFGWEGDVCIGWWDPTLDAVPR